MIEVTKMVDKSVLEKVDIDLIMEHLPKVDKNIFITYCATRQEREEDVWEKDGVLYLRVILDFKKVVSSEVNEVVKMMKSSTFEKLRELKVYG